MPMYWDAYLADTTHLTTEEHGAYLLLLAAMWRRNGSVPDDDKDNARILGLTVAKWRKIKARLCSTISGFHVSDGEISQEKLQKTWQKTQETIEKNRSNGAKGGRPKSSKNNNLNKATGSVSDNPNKTIPEPEPEPYTVPKGTDADGVEEPVELFPSEPETELQRMNQAVWQRGPSFLAGCGVSATSARSVIGKWLKESGPEKVFNALADAKRSGTQDPVAYITKALQGSEITGEQVGDMVADAIKRMNQK